MSEVDLRPATESDVRTFSQWTYESPYDVYDVSMKPDEAVNYFLGPDIRCHVLVEAGDMVGFVTFGPDAQVPGGDYTEVALDIGLGIDPALTGGGRGKRYIMAATAFAGSTFNSQRLRATIAANNVRAQRAWFAAGFRETGRFISPNTVMGTKKFIILTLD